MRYIAISETGGMLSLVLDDVELFMRAFLYCTMCQYCLLRKIPILGSKLCNQFLIDFIFDCGLQYKSIGCIVTRNSILKLSYRSCVTLNPMENGKWSPLWSSLVFVQGLCMFKKMRQHSKLFFILIPVRIRRSKQKHFAIIWSPAKKNNCKICRDMLHLNRCDFSLFFSKFMKHLLNLLIIILTRIAMNINQLTKQSSNYKIKLNLFNYSTRPFF